ncbi:hypothetical protein, partial [Sansalvadorimonas verongulae]|uniref:hypothetical protein n=1 Tax=Sansalvadorimonas verongulae TaxID=2172824 RepID=UPI0018AD2776
VLEFIEHFGGQLSPELLTATDHYQSATLLHVLIQRSFFRAASEVFHHLGSQPDSSDKRRLLVLQDVNGLSVLHSIFSHENIGFASNFIARWSQLIKAEALEAEDGGGETPLHKLFDKEPAPAVKRLIYQCLETLARHFHSGVLSKKRLSDGNTALHLLFAKADPALTKMLLDNCYLQLDREVVFTSNEAGESILQILLRNSTPATAV